MNNVFELQIDYQNDCNLIYTAFIQFKMCKHVRLNGRQGNYDKNKPSNLQKNSLFSKRYIKSNVIALESYK